MVYNRADCLLKDEEEMNWNKAIFLMFVLFNLGYLVGLYIGLNQ